MAEPQSPSTEETSPLRTWLSALGVRHDVVIDAWQLRGGSTNETGDGLAVTLGFQQGDNEIRVRVTATNPQKRALARTKSFDFSHLQVEERLMPQAAKLVRAFVESVQSRDDGTLRLPALAVAGAAASPVSPSAGTTAGGGAYANASAVEPPDPPENRVTGDRHFFDFFTIDAEEVERFPDAIRDMYAGKLGGLIIRNVYTDSEIARVAERLEKKRVAFHETHFPPQFKASFLGLALDGNDPELGTYLPQAAKFREDTAALFANVIPFEQRIEEVVSGMSGGRKVSIPRFRDGRAYSPSTIRHLPPGGQIGSHCGNEAATRPAYTHLKTLIDTQDQISFFLTIQAPAAGGELVVYSLKWSDIGPEQIVDGRTEVNPLLAKAKWASYAPRAGDLLIFDGGRYFHRVSVVKGERTRWTIGGFMMFSKDGSDLFYWG